MFSIHDLPVPAGGTLADARAAVEAARCGDAVAEESRRAILAFVDRHDDALERTCVIGHLTGSALIVDDDRERMLLLLHTKLGRWLQPGGHADGEGHLAAVALREATEETGLTDLGIVVPAVDCDVHEIPARGSEPRHLHLDVRFLILAPPGAAPKGNHESRALRWVTLPQLDELAGDDSLRRLARSGLAVAQAMA